MKLHTPGSLPAVLLATSICIFSSSGWCADTEQDADAPSPASRRSTAEQAQSVQRLQQRVDRLERQLNERSSLGAISGRGPAPSGPAPGAMSAAPASATTGGASAPGSLQSGSEGTVIASTSGTTNPVGTVQGTAITSTQGIPLFENRFSFEQGLTYTHYDKRSLVLSGFLALDAILLGKVNLQQIRTDQFQYDLTGRWNVSDQISTDINLPLVYRNSTYISPGAGNAASAFSDGSNNSRSIGDINAGVYFQLPKRAPSDLDWIVNARLKAPTGRNPFGIKLRENTDPDNNNLLIPTRQPTGNGVWATSFGVSVLKVTDPMVLFANLGYTYNFRRSFSDLSSSLTTSTPGDAKLGNVWSLGAGFALALNEKTSVSFSYAQSLQQVSRLRPDGGSWVRQVGSDSNSISFNAGLTHQLTPRLSMVGTVSMGLTPDAPDVSVGVKFPYSF